MKRWLLAVLAAVACGESLAQSCQEYRVGSTGGWSRSPSSACSSFASSCAPGTCGLAWNHTSVLQGQSVTGSPGAYNCRVDFRNGPDPTPLIFVTSISQRTTTNCPCDTEHPDAGTQFTAGNVSGPNSYCNPVTLCKMNVTARTGDTMNVSHTRENCGDADPDPAQPSEGDPETCQAVGDGQYCASSGGDGQCGYMNDTFTCLKNVAPNECKALTGGGRICGPLANTTPPVPDNGTPGVPATPDGTIEQERTENGATVTNNYSYYNATTVAGSARDPGTDGGADDGGSPSGGSGGDDGGEEPGAPDCEGTTCGEGVPELEDIGTMTEAFTGFWGELQDVPLVEAATDIAPAFPAGACPDWSDTVDVYGETVEADFGFICTTWADVSPVLSFVALVFWGIIALRVLLSA